MQLVPTLLSWLIAINLVTGAEYAFDKVAGRRGGRRISEQMLWLLCLLGGVGGAWLVFFGMRHKTQHRSFWVVQSVATMLWLGLLLWLLVS